MKNKKKNIIILLAVTGVIVLSIVVWGIRQPVETSVLTTSFQSGSTQADVILYYGQECSHCQVVEKFIKDNGIEQRVIFDKKEVWHNIDNSDEMQQKAKECALDASKVGVPFLSARGKCYVGEIEVENFFKKEAGMKK